MAIYVANHMIRRDGKLYKKDDQITLTAEEAEGLLKHRSVSKVAVNLEQPAAPPKEETPKEETPKEETPKEPEVETPKVPETPAATSGKPKKPTAQAAETQE